MKKLLTILLSLSFVGTTFPMTTISCSSEQKKDFAEILKNNSSKIKENYYSNVEKEWGWTTHVVSHWLTDETQGKNKFVETLNILKSAISQVTSIDENEINVSCKNLDELDWTFWLIEPEISVTISDNNFENKTATINLDAQNPVTSSLYGGFVIANGKDDNSEALKEIYNEMKTAQQYNDFWSDESRQYNLLIQSIVKYMEENNFFINVNSGNKDKFDEKMSLKLETNSDDNISTITIKIGMYHALDDEIEPFFTINYVNSTENN